jgi:TM2 domain-containing membrane protein YozV
VADSEVAPEKSKLVAGLLGIFLGGLGAHRFYLGDVTGGIIRIVANIACFAGSIIGLIEGIIYITKSDADFQKIYVQGKKAWF